MAIKINACLKFYLKFSTLLLTLIGVEIIFVHEFSLTEEVSFNYLTNYGLFIIFLQDPVFVKILTFLYT